MSNTTTVTLTLTVRIEEGGANKDTVCERITDLFEYGTIKDAFNIVGLDLIDHKITDHQPCNADGLCCQSAFDSLCKVCQVTDHDTCANNPNCSCCCYTMENAKASR